MESGGLALLRLSADCREQRGRQPLSSGIPGYALGSQAQAGSAFSPSQHAYGFPQDLIANAAVEAFSCDNVNLRGEAFGEALLDICESDQIK